MPVPGGLTLHFTDVTDRRAAEAGQARAARAAATRAARIGALTEALAQALTADDLTHAVAERLLPLFGANSLIMGAVEGQRLRVVGSAGLDGPTISMLDGVGLDAVAPISTTLRAGVPQFVTSPQELRERFPEVHARRPAHPGTHAWAFMPLIASGRPVGYCVLEDLATTTQGLVSELVGNVVRHAKGPLRLRLLRGRTLTCEVYDGSPTTPRIRHAAETDEGGRGLQLVAALSHRWGARYTPDGKCIWTEQLLPAA